MQLRFFIKYRIIPQFSDLNLIELRHVLFRREKAATTYCLLILGILIMLKDLSHSMTLGYGPSVMLFVLFSPLKIWSSVRVLSVRTFPFAIVLLQSNDLLLGRFGSPLCLIEKFSNNLKSFINYVKTI